MATKRRSSGTTTKASTKKPAKKVEKKKAEKPASKHKKDSKSAAPKKAPSPAAEAFAKKCKPKDPKHLELCVAMLRKNKKANQASVDKCEAAIKALRKGKGDRNAGSIKMSLINILASAMRK